MSLAAMTPAGPNVEFSWRLDLSYLLSDSANRLPSPVIARASAFLIIVVDAHADIQSTMDVATMVVLE